MWARPERCQESNGTPGIQTSTGKDDVLAWGVEECIAWHTPLDYFSQRPIAWTRGTESQDAQGNTTYVDQRVWTTGIKLAGEEIDVLLLNGDTGEVERQIAIPADDVGMTRLTEFSAYGGAVDGEDDFWFHALAGNGELVRVDFDDMSYTVYKKPYVSGYGIAVDANGRVWSCHGTTERFDPTTEAWEQASTPTNTAGCMPDGEGRLWAAGRGLNGGGSIVAIDIETMEFVVEYPLPDMPKGTSIDFDGYVWGVAIHDEAAYKIDPETGEFETYDGLTGPYTYSDMTGFGLQNAGTAPVE
ncbi:MAG: hypothetical protein B7733_22135 [Myxococcales bacterium FL481]|nr:MAG: hypothetical protein B7733_22135 [Myxococcales bacterium FL481]